MKTMAFRLVYLVEPLFLTSAYNGICERISLISLEMRDKEDVSKLEILPPPEALLNRSVDSAFHNNTLKILLNDKVGGGGV